MKKINYLLFSILAFSCLNSCADDDDGSNAPGIPEINITNLEITEGDSDNSIEVEVRLSSVSENLVYLNYATNDQSALDASDYSKVEGDLTFTPGELSKVITIEIKGDDIFEEDETFEIVLSDAINGRLLNTTAIITIKNDDTPIDNTNSFIPTTGYTTPLSYPNYTLVWNDEFQGSELDESFWNYEYGNGNSGWGNNELQFYRKENTSIVNNEYLVIEAKEESFGGYNYTSSRLTTQNKKSFKYGRVDLRAALPRTQGLWPALWMLGDNISTAGWPGCGEIDVMEMIGGPNRDNVVHGTIHWDQNGSHAYYGDSYTLSSGVFADEFHVFSVIWDDQKIVWYVDDIQYNVVDITPAALSEFHENFFFIFNVAVGGNWPGSPDGSTVFPQRLIVDYIRVFQ